MLRILVTRQNFLSQMKEENLTDDQVLKNRDNSRRREPNSLPFYHGTMCATAATKMLMRESPGTFLVRKLINSDNFYLSYKTVSGKEIIHSKINSTEGSYYSVSEAPPSTSLRRLVESLKRRGILTIGLTQLGKNTFSPSNSLDHGQEDIPQIPKAEVEDMLKNSSSGTWILRRNELGQLRVSFVMKGKVSHKQLYKWPGELFTMSEDNTENPVPLEGIINNMKKLKMISNKYSER